MPGKPSYRPPFQATGYGDELVHSLRGEAIMRKMQLADGTRRPSQVFGNGPAVCNFVVVQLNDGDPEPGAAPRVGELLNPNLRKMVPCEVRFPNRDGARREGHIEPRTPLRGGRVIKVRTSHEDRELGQTVAAHLGSSGDAATPQCFLVHWHRERQESEEGV